MTLMQPQQQQQQQQAINYYDSIYHLAEVSVHKLNSPPQKPNTEPTLRRQLLVRNVLILSSNIITTTAHQPSQHEEENWLDACFDQLEEEDAYMEEQEEPDNENNLVVMAFPFDYVSSKQDQTIRKGTLFFM